MSQSLVWISILLVVISFVASSPLTPHHDVPEHTQQPNTPKTCDDIKCAEDEDCVYALVQCAEEDLPCEPAPDAFCAKKTNTTDEPPTSPPLPPTCDEIQCAEDETCEQTPIVCCCEPCPPYITSCVKKHSED